MTTAADRRTGMLFALGAYLSWGLVPLYWRALGPVPPFELLAHRVLWSLVLAVVALLVQGRLSTALRPLASRRTAITLAASTLLIGANWVVFILAVQTGRLLHASLGYYISPLVSVVFGLGFLGERLRPGQKVAVALAVVGVLVLVLAARVLPWIAVALAVSFALYGLLRKVAPVDALVGLYLETLLLAPLAAGYLFVRARSGVHLAGATPAALAALALAGPITAIPLLFYTGATRRLPLSMVGFFQFLSPTSQFLIAVAVFGETATRTHLLAFAFIWASMAVFVVEARRAAPSPP
ncbi:MAG: EamA family transporter RarD [Myxococcales bacterium]|nr:EamA family transporter RarD [Myxococcales bacterium]